MLHSFIGRTAQGRGAVSAVWNIAVVLCTCSSSHISTTSTHSSFGAVCWYCHWCAEEWLRAPSLPLHNTHHVCTRGQGVGFYIPCSAEISCRGDAVPLTNRGTHICLPSQGHQHVMLSARGNQLVIPHSPQSDPSRPRSRSESAPRSHPQS